MMFPDEATEKRFSRDSCSEARRVLGGWPAVLDVDVRGELETTPEGGVKLNTKVYGSFSDFVRVSGGDDAEIVRRLAERINNCANLVAVILRHDQGHAVSILEVSIDKRTQSWRCV